MTTQEMVEMRKGGATYQEIANACGLSRQRIHTRIKNYCAEQAKSKYFSQDITFCSNRKCQRKGCKRHHLNADWSVKPYHSFADFTNTQYCPKFDGKDDNE